MSPETVSWMIALARTLDIPVSALMLDTLDLLPTVNKFYNLR